ncbi:MAG TPA: APC family permease [Pilimelia sp.]|nr:APC family permease [Pilimelia sp.]
MTAQSGLARRSIGGGALWFFAVGASSPMTVLAGGIVTAYATTGVVGVPLSFLILMVALTPLTIAYVAMSRHVPHAATFYALLARGVGRPWGVAGAAMALLGYNAIQVALYGLFGATLAGLVGGPWWLWAALAWCAVASLGVMHITINAQVLAGALVAEIAVIALFDVVAFANPAGGSVSISPMLPDQLLVDGVGGVLALSIACFVGYECAAAYGEEARTDRSVGRATIAALVGLGLFYAITGWALAVVIGPGSVVAASGDPEAGLPFSVLQEHLGTHGFGMLALWMATALLVTSILAAMLSFHNTVARYVFALGRERVLPQGLATVGSGMSGGAPTAGSLLQSGLAAVVVAVAAVAGADPLAVLFTWLAAIAAIAVLLLLVLVSAAALRFFRNGGGGNESAWTRVVAPVAGLVFGVAVLAVTVANLSSLLGVPAGSPLTVIVPGVVLAVGVGGLAWGAVLRRTQPQVYADISHGRPHELAVPDPRLDMKV